MKKTQKIQFEILELEVNRQFDSCLLITNSSELNDRFTIIQELINASGWDYNSYIAHKWGWSLLN